MENKLPKNWVETTLGEITTKPQYGWTTKSQDFGSYKYLRTTDIGKGKINWVKVPYCIELPDKIENYLLQKNDILISRAGSIGLSYLVEEVEENCLYASYLIRFKPLVNAKLISYFLFSNQYWKSISDNAVGIAVKNINAPKLQSIAFPLPPLPEQERIVAKLDLLFAQHEKMKIALEKIPQILKDFRQQILTQAVTGKLTEEWREGKDLSFPTKEKIASEIALELLDLNKENSENKRSIFKQNSISFIRKNIDNDWSFYTVESLCVAIVDCLHETAIFSEEGFNIIDTNNIEPFKLNFNKMRYVDNDFYIKWISRLKPRKGDIAFTREANIGNAAMIPENNLYCIGQRTMLFRFSNLLNDKFCEYFMNSEEFKIQYRPLIKGVASQHINIRDLRLLEFPLPSLEEQTQIVSRVESLFSKIDVIELRYQKLKEKLDQLPQTILHKAFKGELVPQLPTDGDAKDLLKEILALKKEGKKK